jgi:hypothetical protein
MNALLFIKVEHLLVEFILVSCPHEKHSLYVMEVEPERARQFTDDLLNKPIV